PTHAWALRNPDFFPIDINKASRKALLRIPGIGVRNVNRIVKARKSKRLKLADLRTFRVALNRAQAFIVTADWSPPDPINDQLNHEEEKTADTLKRAPEPARTKHLHDAGTAALFGEF
ncbi:MAG: biotin synthase, partial [Phycisphaerales bacterium]